MSDLKLYSAGFSANALRARAVAYELGLDFELIEVNVFGGDNKKNEYLALNPNGKVPVLVHGDFVIWESRAIISYLAGLKPEVRLYSENLKTRAIIDQWLYWQAIHLGPAMQKVSFERVMKEKYGMGEVDEEAIAGDVGTIQQMLPVLEKNLSSNEWVAGDLSVADFAMASTFMYRNVAGISLVEFPYVESWIAKLEQLPSWQKAVEPILAMMND